VIADELCPECHGPPELVAVKLDRLVKRCRACGHRWNEERTPYVKPNGYFPREEQS